MKYLYLLFFLIIVSACSSDSTDSAATPGDGAGGSLARFALVGDYLYTVDEDSLRIFDLTDPNKPIFTGEKYVGFAIETLYALDNYLFIGSNLGMFIYDVTDPKFPLKLSEVQHVRSCDPVVSSGDFTYVTLHATVTCAGTVNQLEVYDTQDVLKPKLLTTISLDRPIGLGLYKNHLLVTDEKVVRLFDVAIPSQPKLLGGIEEDAFDLIIRNDELFIIGDTGLSQYTLDPEDITKTVFKSRIVF